MIKRLKNVRDVNDSRNDDAKKETIKTRRLKLLKILLSSLTFNENELLNSLTSLKIKLLK